MCGPVAIAKSSYNRAMKIIILGAILASTLVLPAAAADISGSWSIEGDVVGNPVAMKCAFTQEGAKFTGTCTG